MRTPIKMAVLAISITLGWAGWTGLNALLHKSPRAAGLQAARTGETNMPKKVQKSDAEWKKTLTPEQYKVMIQCGTEAPFSGKYNDFYAKGTYDCAACGTPLFSSETKYDHGTGWPSFMSPVDPAAIEYRDDDSLMMHRAEVRCAACGAHLGHAFDDGPAPSKLHFCINSAALAFRTAGEKRAVKGRAFAAEVDPRAKPGALTRDVNTRLSTAETDPQTKPGAPAAAPAAGGGFVCELKRIGTRRSRTAQNITTFFFILILPVRDPSLGSG
ncbi:MAG: peptide-methionine (R)-S-oxide reductase MsrB [Candidatus Aminicenantes bacterium]|nr:peptide-methionine (R)-S-oxide reductase MsrB [Candidatus Aminicenantes bacterium]